MESFNTLARLSWLFYYFMNSYRGGQYALSRVFMHKTMPLHLYIRYIHTTQVVHRLNINYSVLIEHQDLGDMSIFAVWYIRLLLRVCRQPISGRPDNTNNVMLNRIFSVIHQYLNVISPSSWQRTVRRSLFMAILSYTWSLVHLSKNDIFSRYGQNLNGKVFFVV